MTLFAKTLAFCRILCCFEREPDKVALFAPSTKLMDFVIELLLQ